MSFTCDITGEKLTTRYFIPDRKNCSKGSGSYKDMNHAMQALDERVAKGELKQETARRKERWVMKALNLDERIERPCEGDYTTVAPAGSGPCRQTADDLSRELLLSSRVDGGGGSSQQPVFVKPQCSVELQFEALYHKPERMITSYDEEDWRRPMRDVGFETTHLMPARVNSNGVVLYPRGRVDSAIEHNLAGLGTYKIGVVERTFGSTKTQEQRFVEFSELDDDDDDAQMAVED